MTCKIITVAQQKGGSGKTTVACHIAVALFQAGKKVAVVDIDPQGSLTKWCTRREKNFRADGVEDNGVEYSSVSGWRLHGELDKLKRNNDVVIIDSPPHTQSETKTAIRAADIVIIPMQPSPTDLWATSATVELVNAERIPYRILLNRVIPNAKITENIRKRISNLMEAELGNRVAFADSMFLGKTVTETRPYNIASQEVRAVVSEVEELLFPQKEEETQAA